MPKANERRLSRRPEMTAAPTVPPSDSTLTAANRALPLKTKAENPMASSRWRSPCWVATPKAIPNGTTDAEMDAAWRRIAGFGDVEGGNRRLGRHGRECTATECGNMAVAGARVR